MIAQGHLLRRRPQRCNKTLEFGNQAIDGNFGYCNIEAVPVDKEAIPHPNIESREVIFQVPVRWSTEDLLVNLERHTVLG